MGSITPMDLLAAGQTVLRARNAGRQNREAMNAYRAQAEAQARQMRQAQEIDKRRRDEQLRRALAAQRASFGAGGVAGGTGSAEAVLRGLTERADRESLDAQMLARTRLEDIQRAYLAQRRRSLLESANARSAAAFDLLRRRIRVNPVIDL